MFGSQVLETAIGLVLMFFIVALASSSIVEAGSRILGKRAGDLERGIASLLTGDPDAKIESFKETSVYKAAKAAAGKTLIKKDDKLPSYLSAKGFADAILEIENVAVSVGTVLAIDTTHLPANVKARVDALHREVGNDLGKIRAGLEQWFDETMERVSGSYKRWATAILFVAGLFFAVAANASTFHVADQLWHDPVTRQAVADSASHVVDKGTNQTIGGVAEATDKLKELGLPIGWNDAAKHVFARNWFLPGNWTYQMFGYLLGWIATGLLVMLGAPFWFDLLSKLVSLRSSGGKPPTAAEDPASANRKEMPAPAIASIHIS